MPQRDARAARDIWWFLLIVLVGQTVLSAWNILRTVRDETRVKDTLGVLRVLDQFRTALIDSETGARGFAIAGDRVFLEPYDQAAIAIPKLHRELLQVMSDNPAQIERLEALDPIVQQRLDLLQKMIAARAQPERDILKEIGLAREGKRVMDDIRARLDVVARAEREGLDERLEAAHSAIGTAIFSTIVGGVLTIGILVFAHYLISRDAEMRRRAQSELEQQVLSRTAALNASIAQLNAAAAEQQRTNEQLLAGSEELARSNRELEQFAYVASHDLQEPLRKIQTFSDRLKSVPDATLSEQAQDYIGRMHSAAGRMRRLINDLLVFSRVTMRPQPFEPVDLNEVAREVVDDLEVAISQVGGRVDVGPLPTVLADPSQMRQMFQNLIGNALKFHKPGVPPVVTIRGESLARVPLHVPGLDEHPAVRIEVADNGIGIDEAYCERIFQVFQRLHGRNTYEGTGIGLAVVRRIAERHGGAITVRSAPGEGACFVVILPRAIDDSSTESPVTANSNALE